MSYSPPAEILERYADLLVNWALGGGAGISPGETVCVNASEDAKPLFIEVSKAVWRAGGNVIPRYMPADDAELSFNRAFYELASEQQLDFFPERWLLSLIEQSDHLLHIVGERDPHALAAVDPVRIMRHQQTLGPLIAAQDAKESRGELSWTVALYGTEAMAAEAELTLERYWEQITKACFLDDSDPVARWRAVTEQVHGFRDALNALPIERLRMQGPDCDISFTLGERRRWVAGGGRNVPSFEVFTSPDWRGTDGWIRFSEPLYAFGQLVRGAELRFENGLVVHADAAHNGALLRQLVATENADRVGEFSLTDRRVSRIDHFMASTLYDENVGGPFGNTHLAVGLSLPVAYDGDPSQLGPEDRERLGFNTSTVHTDIVSTTDRTVTATLSDGSQRVIYADGQFQLDGV